LHIYPVKLISNQHALTSPHVLVHVSLNMHVHVLKDIHKLYS